MKLFIISVRSLGSVAFRRAIDKQKKYHFNFFSVDLAEEYSGLYGPALQDQAGKLSCNELHSEKTR